MCVFSSHPFWTSSSLDVPAGVTQEEGHTGFLIHLPSAVLNLNRDEKITRREPGRDGKILCDHRQDGNDEVHRL